MTNPLSGTLLSSIAALGALSSVDGERLGVLMAVASFIIVLAFHGRMIIAEIFHLSKRAAATWSLVGATILLILLILLASGCKASPDPAAPSIEDPQVAMVELAVSDIGTCEVTPDDVARIAKWVRESASCESTGYCWLSDLSPWCGAYAYTRLIDSGFNTPKDPFRAASYNSDDVGELIAYRDAHGDLHGLHQAKKGDVCIFTRDGGGHVAFFWDSNGGEIEVLGGNQSDCVSIAPYSINRLVAIRRPSLK